MIARRELPIGSQGPTRRELLQGALAAGGALLLGCGAPQAGSDGGAACADPFANGTALGTVPFTGEGTAPLDQAFGAGLDGRLYHDLSTLTPQTLITPNDVFYVRTRESPLIDTTQPWSISVGGLVAQPRTLGLADLQPLVAPMGVHLMECSGNGAFSHFGMLSAAAWDGAPLAALLDGLGVLPQASAVLVSGFDQYPQPSANSVPGASWVFPLDVARGAGALLATRMNGAPLAPDHGAPVRLLVPNWYGCTCIKWVNEIRLVDDSEPATSQMMEYASRTMQNGVPALARDYLPASIDQAAMPVRVEKWRVDGKLLYRVVGVMWGGQRVTDALAIRFNPDEPWVPVDVCPPQTTNATWTLWTHAWHPDATGAYAIALHVTDPSIVTRRLDAGYYVRNVVIDEVA
jgi:DMSO/TMAO reductase YedYZ molybdopterin-dependent catalytic subunit